LAEITVERWAKFNSYEKYLHICSEISRAYHYEDSDKEKYYMFLERALYLIDLTLMEGTDETYKYLYLHDRIAEVYAGLKHSIKEVYKAL
jgi:hypothetical protein